MSGVRICVIPAESISQVDTVRTPLTHSIDSKPTKAALSKQIKKTPAKGKKCLSSHRSKPSK